MVLLFLFCFTRRVYFRSSAYTAARWTVTEGYAIDWAAGCLTGENIRGGPAETLQFDLFLFSVCTFSRKQAMHHTFVFKFSALYPIILFHLICDPDLLKLIFNTVQ